MPTKREISKALRKALPFSKKGNKLYRDLYSLHNQVQEKEREIRKWKKVLSSEFNVKTLDFTNIMCDQHVDGHVYTNHFYHGVGKRFCVFCGLDDWDF